MIEISAAMHSSPVKNSWPLFQVVVMKKNGRTKNRLSYTRTCVNNNNGGGGKDARTSILVRASFPPPPLLLLTHVRV